MNNKYLKAIKDKCLDCCCFQLGEVAKCTSVNCPLYRYRFGRNPDKRQYTEEQLAKMREKARHMREGKWQYIVTGVTQRRLSNRSPFKMPYKAIFSLIESVLQLVGVIA